MDTQANAGPHYCPACFYLLRSHALNERTPEAWDRFQTYVASPRDELLESFMMEASPDQIDRARQRASAVVAYREGRK